MIFESTGLQDPPVHYLRLRWFDPWKSLTYHTDPRR